MLSIKQSVEHKERHGRGPYQTCANFGNTKQVLLNLHKRLLTSLGVEVISAGGTAKILEEAGVPVVH